MRPGTTSRIEVVHPGPSAVRNSLRYSPAARGDCPPRVSACVRTYCGQLAQAPSDAAGGVLCRPPVGRSLGVSAVRGVSDPAERSGLRPKPRPRGRSRHAAGHRWPARCGPDNWSQQWPPEGQRVATLMDRKRPATRPHIWPARGPRFVPIGDGLALRSRSSAAIARASLARCSPPSKARRDAPPRSAGLRALTTAARRPVRAVVRWSARERTGCEAASWTDLRS